MIENVMNHIGGVGIFGVISICIFFGFFSVMLLWAGRLKKTYLKTMQDLPLDAELEPASATDQSSKCEFNGSCRKRDL